MFLEQPHTFAATRSTNQDRNTLSPTESVNNSVLYHAGHESKRNHIELHMILTLPYQICLIGSTTSKKSDIAKFFQNFNSIVAREQNQLHGLRGYFWRDRSYRYIPLLTVEDLIEYVTNFVTKPVRDGLVDDPREWLGLSIRPTTEEPLEVHATRPEFCGSRSRKPQDITLEFVNSQLLEQEGVSHAEFLERTEQRITLKIAEYLAARGPQNQEPLVETLTIDQQLEIDPLAFAQIMAAIPTQSDDDYAEYVAASEAHLIYEQRVTAFRRAYRHAFRSWQQATDKNSVNFPIGTYKMRVIHNIPCTANFALE